MKYGAAVGLFSAALTIFVLWGPGQSTAADQEARKPTFKGGVDLVTLSVVVRNQHGRPVAGLSSADFEIVDAGERRTIADFRSEPAPISVALLFDISGSMDVTRKLAAGRDAVRHLVSWLDPGNDQIALFAFDTRLEELQGFTTSGSDVVRQLDSLRPFGSPSLYDAIARTGERLAAQGGPRRAVVVVTDGLDNGSQLKPRDVSGIVSAIDVPVYILAIVSPLDHPGSDTAVDGTTQAVLTGPLEELARWTGGTLFVASAPAHASVAARQIVTELRQQYLIAFEPSARAGWHPLAVRTRDPHLVVRARSGYLAGSRTSSHQ